MGGSAKGRGALLRPHPSSGQNHQDIGVDMAKQFRVVWQDSKRHNKICKGDWVDKATMTAWQEQSAPKLGSNITFEIQQRGK